jgi:hypothetical protein
MMRQYLPLLLTIAFCVPGGTAGYPLQTDHDQAGHARVTGTKVSLTPPANFVPAIQFPGFMDEENGATIMVTEWPLPYTELSQAFTEDNMATKGMLLLAKKDVSFGDKKGILLHVKQGVNSDVFLKWIGFTGNESESVMITATFREDLKTQLTSSLEKAVLSAKWDAALKMDLSEGLDFTIKDDPSLKQASKIGRSLIFTKDGTIPKSPSREPFLVIGPSISKVLAADRRSFAERRLDTTEDLSDVKITKASEVTIDGLPGIEIVAAGRWVKEPTGDATIYQVILFESETYYFLQGFASTKDREKYLPVFNRIAQSFQKK